MTPRAAAAKKRFYKKMRLLNVKLIVYIKKTRKLLVENVALYGAEPRR